MSDDNTQKMAQLLKAAGNITGKLIPETYRTHAAGLRVEQIVLALLGDALTALEAARDLADDTINVESINRGIEFIFLEMGKCAFEIESWQATELIIEASKATKH